MRPSGSARYHRVALSPNIAQRNTCYDIHCAVQSNRRPRDRIGARSPRMRISNVENDCMPDRSQELGLVTETEVTSFDGPHQETERCGLENEGNESNGVIIALADASSFCLYRPISDLSVVKCAAQPVQIRQVGYSLQRSLHYGWR